MNLRHYITIDIVCAVFLGISLIISIISGYNDNLSCTIAGALGGAITGYKYAEGKDKREGR